MMAEGHLPASVSGTLLLYMLTHCHNIMGHMNKTKPSLKSFLKLNLVFFKVENKHICE